MNKDIPHLGYVDNGQGSLRDRLWGTVYPDVVDIDEEGNSRVIGDLEESEHTDTSQQESRRVNYPSFEEIISQSECYLDADVKRGTLVYVMLWNGTIIAKVDTQHTTLSSAATYEHKKLLEAAHSWYSQQIHQKATSLRLGRTSVGTTPIGTPKTSTRHSSQDPWGPDLGGR